MSEALLKATIDLSKNSCDVDRSETFHTLCLDRTPMENLYGFA